MKKSIIIFAFLALVSTANAQMTIRDSVLAQEKIVETRIKEGTLIRDMMTFNYQRKKLKRKIFSTKVKFGLVGKARMRRHLTFTNGLYR